MVGLIQVGDETPNLDDAMEIGHPGQAAARMALLFENVGEGGTASGRRRAGGGRAGGRLTVPGGAAIGPPPCGRGQNLIDMPPSTTRTWPLT